jgi:hypothetical protein
MGTETNTDWPEGHTVIIDGVTYGEDDLVPGTDKTFNDPWWAIVGPGGMTNWQVFGPGGAGGYADTSQNPDWFGQGEVEGTEGTSGGGRRATSRSGGMGDDDDNAPVEGWFDEFKQHFPGYARLLEAVPSLMDTVGAWWEDEKDADYNQQYNSLLGAIKGSDWYEDHEEPLRDSYILQFTDPAQWEANLETNRFDLKSIAKEEGLYDYFDTQGGYWDRLADLSERNSWSKEQIRTRLVQDGLASPTAPVRGNIKRNMDRIKSYAEAMMVGMNDTDARKFATYMEATGGFYETQPAGPGASIKTFQGSMSWADVQDHIQGLAQNKWGFIDVDDLSERGMTIADTLTEVKAMIAGTLQLNLEDVNLMGLGVDDLVVGEAPEGADSSGGRRTTGRTLSRDNRRFMDVQEAENWAKRQSRYQMTDGFRGDVNDLAGSIAQAWGTR